MYLTTKGLTSIDIQEVAPLQVRKEGDPVEAVDIITVSTTWGYVTITTLSDGTAITKVSGGPVGRVVAGDTDDTLVLRSIITT